VGTLATFLPQLSVSSLMSRGLFHDRIVPAFHANDLTAIIDELVAFADRDLTSKGKPRKSTRCVQHSYPKRKLARRILSIPHPRNQIFLAREVVAHWNELKAICDRSQVSLTRPIISSSRALQGAYERKAEGVERTKRSVGTRFVLHADIARFYPSIYTHSIPWAIHGKDQRHDTSAQLFGNQLDLWVRETQSKQTGGIPVGPDTSFLIAEAIASTIDHALQEAVGLLRGTRYIDDYHLYFVSHSDAEKALAELHRVASLYELDINDLKTSIEQVPEPIEPHWKTQLRAAHIQKADHATSFKAIFDLAAKFAKENPQDGVFAYLVKKVEAIVPQLELSAEDWVILDALLLRAVVGEPACMPTVLRIFEQNNRNPERASDALGSICLVHAGLQQASEVAWALWTSKRLNVELSQEVADAVEGVDDDVVALIALNLHDVGLLPEPEQNFAPWRQHMTANALYSEHWLLAYEARVQGWLPSVSGVDYIARDSYFSILATHEVRFFDTSDDVEVPEDSGYEDEDSYYEPDYDDDEEEEDLTSSE
jgi:hypothetical protein